MQTAIVVERKSWWKICRRAKNRESRRQRQSGLRKNRAYLQLGVVNVMYRPNIDVVAALLDVNGSLDLPDIRPIMNVTQWHCGFLHFQCQHCGACRTYLWSVVLLGCLVPSRPDIGWDGFPLATRHYCKASGGSRLGGGDRRLPQRRGRRRRSFKLYTSFRYTNS